MGPILAPSWKKGDALAFHFCRARRSKSKKIGWNKGGWDVFLNGTWFIGGRTKKIAKEFVKEWRHNTLQANNIGSPCEKHEWCVVNRKYRDIPKAD